MPARPFLAALAEQVGILPSYVDQFGRTHRTPDRVRVALLAAMGFEVRSEVAARAELTRWRERRAAQLIAPVRVADSGAARRLAIATQGRPIGAWALEIETEDGARRRITGTTRRGAGAVIRLPPLPLGYHRVRLLLNGGARDECVAEQRLIVVPAHCPTPRQRLGPRRVYGLLANLYTLRSAQNWGFGDLSDLRRLIDWAAECGASFVGINPLHALANRGQHISPYSPLSRLFRNVLYLDVTAAPEWRTLTRQPREQRAEAQALRRLRAADAIDYAAVRGLKRRAFAALHRAFVARHRDATTSRGRAYARYLATQGEPLRDFATFVALQAHFERRGIMDVRRWPAAFRDPRSAVVGKFRAAARERIDRECYLQFELDRQLGAAAAAARTGAMPVGVYQDLAIGSAAGGSDVWAFPDLFLERIEIGAPPDDYSRVGQNWSLPPINPHVLAATGYEYWIRLVRAALRHAGALRVDHVMGLFRQYWIPRGASGAEGAYVRFPAADLLGILALESQRAGALVIGEDLGTVPRGLPRQLARWSILSTRVLYFERDRRTGFRPARAYPRRALVAANTHDLAPLAAFWEGRDLVLRHRLGLLDDRALARAQVERERARRALVRRLRHARVLPRRRGMPDGPTLRAAVHAFLGRTPAVLGGVSLDDLAGEVTPVNLPGVPLTVYPSWSRRMRLPLESLPTDGEVARALDALPASNRATKPNHR
jgi:4-alpha-glucanotransferase